MVMEPVRSGSITDGAPDDADAETHKRSEMSKPAMRFRTIFPIFPMDDLLSGNAAAAPPHRGSLRKQSGVQSYDYRGPARVIRTVSVLIEASRGSC